MAQTNVPKDTNTTFLTTKRVLEEKLFREAAIDSYFQKFSGTGTDSIVQVKTQLEKAKGDRVIFTLIQRLAGSGITGTSGLSLEGNEESLTAHTMSLWLEEYCHAVRDDGRLTRQRAFFEVDDEAKSALKVWMTEKIERIHFDALFGSAFGKTFYGGDATSTADIEAADKLTPALISKAKTWALTGGNRAQTPIRPVKVDGKMYYVLLTHPDVMYDLKQDSTFAQARREAEVRGKDNPIFSGATAVWDGVVIHEHELCPIYTTWGTGAIAGAKCALMGAQALLMAYGMRPEITAEEFDYGRQHGFGIGLIGNAGRAIFNSKDYGCLGITVSRTKISDA